MDLGVVHQKSAEIRFLQWNRILASEQVATRAYIRTFLFDSEAGLGDRQEGEGLVSHEQNFVSADGGQKEQVAEEQRPVGFGAATLDAAEVTAENPLPATRVQLERLRKIEG